PPSNHQPISQPSTGVSPVLVSQTWVLNPPGHSPWTTYSTAHDGVSTWGAVPVANISAQRPNSATIGTSRSASGPGRYRLTLSTRSGQSASFHTLVPAQPVR